MDVLIYSLAIFGGGFAIGYYIAYVREHRLHMARLDQLMEELKVIDKERKNPEVHLGYPG